MQRYIGRCAPVLDRVVERFVEGRSHAAAEKDRAERLVAQLRVGGALSVDVATARILSALADAAVFRLGGVLVGTVALRRPRQYARRWQSGSLRTDDIDLATDRYVEVAVPELKADVPKVLDSLKTGFLPDPGLSPKAASTSFRVRGHSLRVDLVTPQRHAETKPILIPRLGAAALRHAFEANPSHFKHRIPTLPAPPTEVWINPPEGRKSGAQSKIGVHSWPVIDATVSAQGTGTPPIAANTPAVNHNDEDEATQLIMLH